MSREAKIAEQRKRIPKMYRGIYDRAVKTKSLRAAVNVMCLECCGYQRIEVALCTDTACPLWKHRPYQESRISAKMAEIISKQAQTPACPMYPSG